MTQYATWKLRLILMWLSIQYISRIMHMVYTFCVFFVCLFFKPHTHTYSISPESYEQWHPHNWTVTTTNHLPPHLASYLVCVCLNIIAQAYPWLIKLCVFYYNFNKKAIQWLNTQEKCNINWNVKRFSLFDITQVILARTNSNLCRKELTVHWSTPNSLIRSYLQPCTNSMWGDESEAVAPIIWLYQTVDAWNEEEVFFPNLLITLRRYDTQKNNTHTKTRRYFQMHFRDRKVLYFD